MHHCSEFNKNRKKVIDLRSSVLTYSRFYKVESLILDFCCVLNYVTNSIILYVVVKEPVELHANKYYILNTIRARNGFIDFIILFMTLSEFLRFHKSYYFQSNKELAQYWSELSENYKGVLSSDWVWRTMGQSGEFCKETSPHCQYYLFGIRWL